MIGVLREENIISFYKDRDRLKIDSRNPIFADEVIITISLDKLTIKRASISDEGKRRKLYKKKNRDSYVTTLSYDIEPGSYIIDKEESTEDKLVIYLNQ